MDVYRADILDIADEITAAYVEVFAAPPFNRVPEETVGPFNRRLEGDAHREGFGAFVERDADGAIAGFAYGWITPAPFRTDRSYGSVAAMLGPERVEKLMIGAVEVDELAVRATARGTGLGRRLLAALTADAPEGRAWLLTWAAAHDTQDFYERVGWHRVRALPGVETDVVVYLSPDHPGADLA